MFVFKMTIVIGIVSICSYLGILKSKTFENRVINLRKIQTALNMFKTKIEFTYEPIKDIFEEISIIIYQNTDNIFQNTIRYMKQNNVSIAWYEAIENSKKDFTLEDKECLKTMGKLLGKTDKEGQIREICLTENLLENQIQKAEFEKSKNAKLYKTLGTVFGLGIGILFF